MLSNFGSQLTVGFATSVFALHAAINHASHSVYLYKYADLDRRFISVLAILAPQTDAEYIVFCGAWRKAEVADFINLEPEIAILA